MFYSISESGEMKMRKEKHLEESISEIKFRYHTKSEAYMNKSSDINELSKIVSKQMTSKEGNI